MAVLLEHLLTYRDWFPTCSVSNAVLNDWMLREDRSYSRIGRPVVLDRNSPSPRFGGEGDGG